MLAGPAAGALVGKGYDALMKRNQIDPSAMAGITREQLPYVGSQVSDMRMGNFLGGQQVGGITRETFQIPMPGTQVRDLTAITPLGQVGFRDQNGQMHYTGGNNAASFAAQAAGGASQGGGIGYGWTGIDGAAARSMFGGMRAGSDAAMRQADMAAMRRMRQ